MKKVLIALGVIIGLLLAAAIIVPLVVDVDKYRPQVVQVANEKLNGKLELGKLSLSLWGQIRVEVAGLGLQDAQKRSVLSVKDAYFHIPFMSVLSGAPILTFKMSKPTIHVIKDKNGKLNVLSLMKPEPGATGADAAATPAPGAPAPNASEIKLPGLAVRARLGLELRDALVTYKDAATDLTTDIRNFNFIVRDLSLSRPSDIELTADLDTKMGKSITVKGPVKLTGKSQATVAEGKVQAVSLTSVLHLNDLEILMPGLFEKRKGIEAGAELSLTGSERELVVDRLDLKFFNARLQSKAKVSNFTAPVVHFETKSNTIELKPWVELVPMLRDFELGGAVTLTAAADGPADRLTYEANVGVQGMTAKAPKLKTQPRIDGKIHVLTDRIESMDFTMKAPGNELALKGKLVSFLKPRVELALTSPGMDLDQLVEFPPRGKAAAGTPATGGGAPPQGEAAPAGIAKAPAASDFDALLEPLRTNAIAKETSAVATVSLKVLKAYDVKMTDVAAKLTMRDLTAVIDQFSMKLWSGSVKATGSTAMAPKTPTYKFSASVAGLELSEAVASQFQLFKNTLLGKANFEMNGEGASYNPDPAIGNLKAKGSMKVEKATFATIDIGKMATEGINKAIERLSEKVPPLKGRKIGGLPGGSSRYEFISSDFTIGGAKFTAPNFVAKAEPNAGIDLKGTTEVGLKDYALNTRWEIIDTYNLTKARDITVEQAGVQVPHILAEGSGPVRFPVSAGCTVFAPCYSYTEVPEFLAKVALGNLSGAAQGRAKAEAQKKAQELIKKAPAPLQKGLEDLGKKLFGR